MSELVNRNLDQRYACSEALKIDGVSVCAFQDELRQAVNSLGPEYALFFSSPFEGSWDCLSDEPCVPFSKLSPPEQANLESRYQSIRSRILRLAKEKEAKEPRLSRILTLAIQIPSKECLWSCNGCAVATHWGHKTNEFMQKSGLLEADGNRRFEDEDNPALRRSSNNPLLSSIPKEHTPVLPPSPNEKPPVVSEKKRFGAGGFSFPDWLKKLLLLLGLLLLLLLLASMFRGCSGFPRFGFGGGLSVGSTIDSSGSHNKASLSLPSLRADAGKNRNSEKSPEVRNSVPAFGNASNPNLKSRVAPESDGRGLSFAVDQNRQTQGSIHQYMSIPQPNGQGATAGDYVFLIGTWLCDYGELVNGKTGQAIRLLFRFGPNGVGEAICKEEGGDEFRAAAKASLEDGRLYIHTESLRSMTRNNVSYAAQHIVCRQRGAQAYCRDLSKDMWDDAKFLRIKE